MSDNPEPTLEQLEYLAGKALLEPNFRTSFLTTPEEAARSLKIYLTPKQVHQIKALDATVMEDLADAIDHLVDAASIDDWH
jgi:hypothetical protein